MRRDEAVTHLPTAYAVALRLRDRGVADDVIAYALGLDEAAVGSLLRLAEAKLQTLDLGTDH